MADPEQQAPPRAQPKKGDYRCRAHSNPFSDRLSVPYPRKPSCVPVRDLYPAIAAETGPRHVDMLDVGCGYGGLSVSLAEMFPDKLVMGMEIRDKVCEYVRQRILALRAEQPGKFGNVAVVRANAMKYIANWIPKHQLEKIFFLFPDPHFKKSNHRRRIISPSLLSEYAYLLKPGGIAYTITDVEDLYRWMNGHLAAHPLFEPLTEAELVVDPVIKLIRDSSEEAKKVSANNGQKYMAVYRRKL